MTAIQLLRTVVQIVNSTSSMFAIQQLFLMFVMSAETTEERLQRFAMTETISMDLAVLLTVKAF